MRLFACSFLAAAMLVAALVPARAQVPPSQSLVPREVGGVPASEGGKVAAPQLEQLFPEHAAVLRELGAQLAERRAYQRPAGVATITVIQFRDPTGAYGGFNLLRQPGMAPADLAELAALSPERALFAISNLVTLIEGRALPAHRDELRLVAETVTPFAAKEAGPFPNLAQHLPQGAIEGSRRFVIGPAGLEQVLPTGKGDWVGFDFGAEVESARYRMRGQEATLLLISYPTPQVAMSREKALSRWFNVNRAEDVVEGRPVVFTRRMASLLAVMANAPPAAQKDSEALMAKINYVADLTWNEPSFKATEEPWGRTLYKVFLGTFYFVGIGLGIGISFALIRLVIKRLFPGKVFDRPGSVEILQLGIGSKPIEGKDFYQ